MYRTGGARLPPGVLVGFSADDNTDTLADLWEDRDRVTPAANPITLDEYGNSPPFYAEPAIYRARRMRNGAPVTPYVRIEVEVDSEDAIVQPTGAEAEFLGHAADEAAMLAYAPAGIGDWVIRDDTNTVFSVVTGDGSVVGDWVEMPYPVSSVNGEVGNVALDAADIPNTPAGTIAATDVQGALNELDAEKATTGSVAAVAADVATLDADLDAVTADVATLTTDVATVTADVATVTADLASHEGATTNVHGIADTAQLVDNADLAATLAGYMTLATPQTATGQKTMEAASAATVGFIVKGAAAQSANLQQWRDSTDAVLAAVTAAGALALGAAADTVLSRQSAGVFRASNIDMGALLTNTAVLMYQGLTPATQYGFAQDSNANTYVNAGASKTISLSIANSAVATVAAAGTTLNGGTTANLWLNSDTAAITGGLTLGTARDTALYRNAAGQLRTTGQFRADQPSAFGGAVATDRFLSVGGQSTHPGSATTLYGVAIDPTIPATTTVAANALYAVTRTAASAFTVANTRGVLVDSPVLGAGSAVTTATGVLVQGQNVSGVTTSLGLDVVTGNTYAARLSGGATANLWLNSDTASVLGGIALGTTRDTGLFRQSAALVGTLGGLQVNGAADIRPTASAAKALQVRASTTSPGNILELQSSAGTAVVAVDSVGRTVIGSPTVATDTMLRVGNGATSPVTGGNAFGIWVDAVIPSTAGVSYAMIGQIKTAASAFTVTRAASYLAFAPTLGAGSAITDLMGFYGDNLSVSGVATSHGVRVITGNTYTANLEAGLTANVWLNSDVASIAGGIALGTARDTSLFRDASNRLATGGGFRAAGIAAVGATAVSAPAVLAVSNLTTHPSTATSIFGVTVDYAAPSTATVASYNYYAQVRTSAAAFTLALGVGMLVTTPSVGAGSAITTTTGVNIASQAGSGITTSYGLIVNSGNTIAARLDGGTTANLWLNTDTASILGGVAFGTSRDVGLFRSGAGSLSLGSAQSFLVPGSLGINGPNSNGVMVSVGGANAHPATTGALWGIALNYVAPSTATTQINGIATQLATAAASFTSPEMHQVLMNSPTIGAGSAVTTAYGLRVRSQSASGIGTAIGVEVASGSHYAARLSGGATANLWLNSDTASVLGGIALGTARDTVIIRNSAGVVGVQGISVSSTHITLADANNLVLGTTTGTKIGSATTQKLALWNATPIVQPTRVGPIVDNSGGASTSPTIPAVAAASVDTTAASLTTTRNAIASLAAAVAAIDTRLSAAAGGIGLTA